MHRLEAGTKFLKVTHNWNGPAKQYFGLMAEAKGGRGLSRALTGCLAGAREGHEPISPILGLSSFLTVAAPIFGAKNAPECMILYLK